jgi:hypothetical protein
MDLPKESLKVLHIDEPELSFGHGQTCDHPKDGLFLYGPHSGPTRPREVSVGVIGTKDGLSYFRNWAIALGGFVPRPATKKNRQRAQIASLEFSRTGRGVGHYGQSRRVCATHRRLQGARRCHAHREPTRSGT